MPRIRDWLRKVVHDPAYREHIWWHDEKRSLIAIHWKHGSYEDYADQDSALFRKWAIDNNRYDHSAADSRDERKRWKTNFRNALHTATNIKTKNEGLSNKHDKDAFRVYELLEIPDPQKVFKKKKSNVKAAKSKQKPSNQKRVYHSRLNKPAVKQELKESELHFTESQIQAQYIAAEAAKVINFADSQSPIYREESCEALPFSDVSPDELPTTIHDFNEEDEGEDGGYHSSDSLSINSLDSNSLSLITDEEYIKQSPPESFLSLPYSVGPLPNAHRTVSMADDDFIDYTPFDMDDPMCFYDNQRSYEISTTENASTELYRTPESTYQIYTGQPDDGQPDFSYLNL